MHHLSLLSLRPRPSLYMHPLVEVRTASCCVPESDSMLGFGGRQRVATTATLPINPISKSSFNTNQQSLLSSTRLPFTPVHLKSPRSFTSSPLLALLYLLFVLSTAIGAMISLAIISLPTINAFKRLGDSMNKFSQVVSEEVPGTLSSLRLSVHEIYELTKQLTDLRQKISGTQHGGNKDTSNKHKL